MRGKHKDQEPFPKVRATGGGRTLRLQATGNSLVSLEV
jgi:hypothetical protein